MEYIIEKFRGGIDGRGERTLNLELNVTALAKIRCFPVQSLGTALAAPIPLSARESRREDA